MKSGLTIAILVLAAAPASAHRLDEYLQGTILSVGKTRIHAQMTLTPGVAVFPIVMPGIDTDGDGSISDEERHAYAARVLRDVSFTIDGKRLSVRLVSMQFPAVDEMKEGRGEIQLDFDADLPPGVRNRKLTFENHHMTPISAYLANCLVPSDPDIRIAAQTRNYSQSRYELEYVDAGVPAGSSFLSWSGGLIWIGPIALLLCFRLPLWWRQRAPHSQSSELNSRDSCAS